MKSISPTTQDGYTYYPAESFTWRSVLEECLSTPIPEALEVTPETFLLLCKCDAHRTLRNELKEYVSNHPQA
jgi:hypothetical protein